MLRGKDVNGILKLSLLRLGFFASLRSIFLTFELCRELPLELLRKKSYTEITSRRGFGASPKPLLEVILV